MTQRESPANRRDQARRRRAPGGDEQIPGRPCPLRVTVAGDGGASARYGYLFGSDGCAGSGERVRRLCSAEAKAASGGHAIGARGVLLFIPIDVYPDWCRGQAAFAEVTTRLLITDVESVDEVVGYDADRPVYRRVWSWADAPAPQRALAERFVDALAPAERVIGERVIAESDLAAGGRS